MPRAPVIVHYHIYKNAGSSIDQLLQESFRGAWAAFEGQSATDVLNCDQLTCFLDSNPQVRAVSSHQARPPLPLPHDGAIIMLRHPIDRVKSVWAFACMDASQPDHGVARSGGLRGYVRWALDNPAGVVIRNYQVVHLSEASLRPRHIFDAIGTAEDLRQVLVLLRSLGTFGLVRRFEDSCRVFQAHYTRSFPALRLHPVHENATDKSGTPEQAAIGHVRDELGPALYAQLLAANELDLALYDDAMVMFEEALDELTAGGSTRRRS